MDRTDATAMQSSAAPQAKISESDLGQTIENYLSGLVKADEFSGVVLVAKNGLPVFSKAYGLASKEFDIPNRLDTKFNLGSLNKLFWSEMSQRMHDTLMDLLGPAGLCWQPGPRAIAGGRLTRSYLYYRAASLFAGTSEIQRNILAERVLGLPRVR